jgi:transposase-like protein
VKHGKSAVGKQRYRCQNSDCPYRTFVLTQTYPGRTRQVKQQIVEMTLNGSGVRDIARVLHVSPTTVIQELKKLAHFKEVNQKLLRQLEPESVEVEIVRVEELEAIGIEESELDEMWSYVGKKSNPRWREACHRPSERTSAGLCVLPLQR